jgi:hypothetical protein
VIISVSDVASVISAAAAAVAAYFAFRTITESRRRDAEQQAFEYIRKYLEIAIEHPDLSTEGGKKKAEQKYEWYVSFILLTAKSVLQAFPDNAVWRKLMREQLIFNRDALSEWKHKDKYDFGLYGTEVAELVDEALENRQ